MFTAGLGQLGGIGGGVGEAMAISLPLSAAGKSFNEAADAKTTVEVELAQVKIAAQKAAAAGEPADDARISALENELQRRAAEVEKLRPANRDALTWATIITAITAVMLALGRYGFIQTFATVLVAGFTLVTVVNVIALQFNPAWAVQWGDLVAGLSFRLPPSSGPQSSPLATALKTFGIIGVGASELVAYPYWCLEKGYARFTGPRDESAAWGERARGWMRVLRWDAWCSMVVYTFATLAFYLLGAAILGRSGLNPSNDDLIRTLSVMYEPVFGRFADVLFLLGAFAVLYSTFFVANAGHGRVFTDAMRVIGLIGSNPRTLKRSVRCLSAVFPCLCLLIYWQYPKPANLVLFSGLMQAMMLPMLAG
ncbi:MAG: Nramp family divalent metal transporter, partial [Pirellulaceae bacterium]